MYTVITSAGKSSKVFSLDATTSSGTDKATGEALQNYKNENLTFGIRADSDLGGHFAKAMADHTKNSKRNPIQGVIQIYAQQINPNLAGQDPIIEYQFDNAFVVKHELNIKLSENQCYEVITLAAQKVDIKIGSNTAAFHMHWPSE
jgi:hypothetical protein